MSDAVYSPDRWALVEFTSPRGNKHVKVAGSWYGGFAGSNEWRLSSGLKSAAATSQITYDLVNESGSTYRVGHNYGMSGLMLSVLAGFRESRPTWGIREMDEAEALAHVAALVAAPPAEGSAE